MDDDTASGAPVGEEDLLTDSEHREVIALSAQRAWDRTAR